MSTNAETTALSDYKRFLSRVAVERKDPSSQFRGGKLRPDNVPLSFGYPYAESLPVADLTRATAASLAEEGQLTLQYGGGPSSEQLRKLLFERVIRRGVKAQGNDVLLTAGSMQGLDLVGRVLLDPGDLVMVEAPTYFGALRVFQTWRAQIVGFPLDGEGLVTDAVEAQLARWRQDGRPIPKLFYVIADFHNPGGVTMSLRRRRALLDLAEKYDFLILDDNAYGELRFEGQGAPLLKAMDDNLRVIHTGTFSKTIAPGVRLGWVVGPQPLIEEMTRVNVGGGLSTFVTGALYAFVRDGDLDRRIDGLRTEYRRRKDAMVSSLETHMPEGVTWNNPEGGFFLWLEVPAEVDMEATAAKARDLGVTFVGGTAFFTDGRGRNYARLCFSFCDNEQLERGVGILAGLVKEQVKG
jgi:2-aminoadipate transaminase